MNIYEVHLGSWRRHEDGSVLSYRELAEPLIDYLKEMQFTHIELMPIWNMNSMLHGVIKLPFILPRRRYGEPEDLKYLIDQLHQAGFGVIIDFVPMHFIVNSDYLAPLMEPLYMNM